MRRNDHNHGNRDTFADYRNGRCLSRAVAIK
jgi:hypothetical protein